MHFTFQALIFKILIIAINNKLYVALKTKS